MIKRCLKWYGETALNPNDWTEGWFVATIILIGILPVSPLYINTIKHEDIFFSFVVAYFWAILVMLILLFIWLYYTGEGKKIWRELKSKEKKQN